MSTGLATRETTEAMWRERVRAWRASGETAATFAARHGFSRSTLSGWSSRLGPEAKPAGFVRVVARPAPTPASLVLEVGTVRICVGPGFDAPLLAEVLRALEAMR